MARRLPLDDSKYAGPSKTIEVLGKGNAYGWVGTVTGAVLGGAWTAISTSQPGTWSRRFTEAAKTLGVHIDGKWAIMGGGAFLGAQILHFVGVAVGLREGAFTAGQGQAQFDRVRLQCENLRGDLDELKEERARHQKEFHKDEMPNSGQPTQTIHTITREGVSSSLNNSEISSAVR